MCPCNRIGAGHRAWPWPRRNGRGGARIAVHGLATPEEAAESQPGADCEKGAEEARFFARDMRDPEAIALMIDAVEDDWGPVDILVNNAGIQRTAVHWPR